MSRHKHKNPRVKVYFRHKGHLFKLFEAINFGTKSEPQLKIKGLAETYMQIRDDQKRFDGQIHVGQQIRFLDGNHVEFTYHKDGSVLTEVIQPSGKKEHDNPYGTGERWTPLAAITTYQPVMTFQIQTLSGYHRAFIEEKYGLTNYVVKNERLFELERGQRIVVLIYMKDKNYPLAKYCIYDMIYSDVLMKFGDKLELCILIQKQMHPENAGAMIENEFWFVDRLDGFEYLSNILTKHIFDLPFADFINVIQEGGRFFNISEKMMQVIESVDPLYDYLIREQLMIHIHKPQLVRLLLDRLDGKYDEYLGLSSEEQLKYVISLYIAEAMMISQQRDKIKK